MSEPSAAAALFDLDEDHLAFREVCRNFVAREMTPLVRDAEQAGTFPPELWPKMADAGLLGLGHPEEYGGSGGGVLATTILSEGLAHASGGLAITPLVSSYMAAPHLARCGRCSRVAPSPRSPSPSPAPAPTSPPSPPAPSRSRAATC
jgi:alkylation response protein AidB-like acyl-CoA dehydrogenase